MPSIIISNGLRGCKDFADFSDAQIEELGTICKTIDYAAHHDVFSTEQQECYIFVVVFGRLSLRLKGSDQVKIFTQGNLFGEIAVFSAKGRLGAIHCLEKSTLIAIDKEGVLNAGALSIELRLNLITILAKKMANYFYKELLIPCIDIINSGEGSRVEFKRSFADKSAIEESIISFMNWKGGTVLIGVEDNGKVVGLGVGPEAIDRLANSLLTDLKAKCKQVTAIYVDYRIDEVKNKKIVRINVNPSEIPAVIKTTSANHHLLVRTGAQNTHLQEPGEIVEYARKRFEGDGVVWS